MIHLMASFMLFELFGVFPLALYLQQSERTRENNRFTAQNCQGK